MVGHAGAALLWELADRLGLTTALGWRQAGGRRRHPDAAVLRDLAVMLADGGDCLSDLAALRDQPELFGPWPRPRPPGGWSTASPGTLRGWPPAGRPGHARGRAWAVGAHSEPEVLIVDADATLVTADSDPKQGAAAPTSARWGFICCWPAWTAPRRRLISASTPAQPHRPRTPPTPTPPSPHDAS